VKLKIPCFCDNTFTVEVPGEIDLDAESRYLDEIMAGSFMNFICASCGKKHKPEFPLLVLWPSRKTRLSVIPEPDRMSFYRLKREKETGEQAETVIGFPELADRLGVIRDGLEPAVIEALKYYLYLKADETYPEGDISIWYQYKKSESLEFHLHGIREDSMAVTQVPLEVYDKTLAEYQGRHKSELFSSLRFGSYLSVQNMMLPGELK
jgi:hypothetical protein